jgi:hypothetical protein
MELIMDYSNHHPRGRHKPELSAWSRILLATFIVIVMGGGGFLIYEYKTNKVWAGKYNEYHASVTSWLAERKKNMHHGIAKVRTSSRDQESQEEAVNFEFYNTLQEMQSMEVEAQAEAQRKIADKSVADAKAKTASVKTVAVKKTENAAPVTKKQKQVKISQAIDLENDLLATMKKKNGE